MRETPESIGPDLVRRDATRVIVLDRDDRVLLFRGHDPGRLDAGSWWFTPGGGLEAGESFVEAGVREVVEETGLQPGALLGPLYEQTIEYSLEGVSYLQYERFFYARLDSVDLADSHWTPLEQRSIIEHRWWPIGDLLVTTDTVYPAALLDLLVKIRATG